MYQPYTESENKIRKYWRPDYFGQLQLQRCRIQYGPSGNDGVNQKFSTPNTTDLQSVYF